MWYQKRLSCGYNTFHDGSIRAALPDTPNDSAKINSPQPKTQCHQQQAKKRKTRELVIM